jgi:hypothetical protein
MSTTIQIADVIADLESYDSEVVTAAAADITADGYRPLKVIAEGRSYRLVDGRDMLVILALTENEETTVEVEIEQSRAAAHVPVSEFKD